MWAIPVTFTVIFIACVYMIFCFAEWSAIVWFGIPALALSELAIKGYQNAMRHHIKKSRS